MLPSGTQVSRYVVLDQLGEGAMGEVYRAWDNALDRVVALKVLLPLRVESTNALKRFSREARLAARINHPCVAHVYDVGEHEESPFIAMEFVPGRQLRGEMGSPMNPGRIVFLARQILDGLTEAHHQGVVHRDLKPENILISGRDQVKILDFGLAKPVHDDISEATDFSTTGLTGTPRYMAPEQIQGTDIDPRTDIYALGTLLYEMVTGTPVHSGTTLAEMLMSVVHKPAPELPEELCPPVLAQVIKRSLQKAPSERFPDAPAMTKALEQFDAVEPLDKPIPQADEHIPHPRAVVFTQRGRESLTGISSASSLSVEMLEQAMELDPHYALARAVHAEACAAVFHTGYADPIWLDKAQDSLERAEELNPNLPDVRVARARIVWNKTFNFPAETALRELRWALRADPDHLGALRLWSTITSHVGLFDLTEAAVARYPEDEILRYIAASLHVGLGREEQALAILAQSIRLDPNHEETHIWWVYARALMNLGQLTEAEEAIQNSLRRQPDEPLSLSLLSTIRALLGDEQGARDTGKKAEECLRVEMHPHHVHHLMACTESILGDIDLSLHWIARTANEGMPCWPWFSRDPLLKNLRADRKGQTFLEELHRRFDFFVRAFPLNEPTDLSMVATEVAE